MNNFAGIVLLLIIIGGLYYFWYKCQMFAVSKVTLIMGFLFWPVGVIAGIYWVIKDIYVFRKFSRDEEIAGTDLGNKTEDSKQSIKSNSNYLKKSEEFRGQDLDKYSFSAVLDDGNVIKKSEKTIVPNSDISGGEPLTLDEAYLQALDEYESKNFDRALYARLLAENDGKEELVKSRYIKLRAENLLKK
jgi:hypothetical protein